MTMKTKNPVAYQNKLDRNLPQCAAGAALLSDAGGPGHCARTEPVRRDCRSVSERGKLTRGGFGYTTSREKIHTLIDALARGAVTPETLRDVVDDWL